MHIQKPSKPNHVCWREVTSDMACFHFSRFHNPRLQLMIGLSVCLCLSRISICMSACLSLSVCRSMCFSLSICMSICFSLYLTVCLCVSLYLSAYLCICLYLSVGLCVSLYLSICLCVFLSICLNVYVSLYLSACQCVCLYMLPKKKEKKVKKAITFAHINRPDRLEKKYKVERFLVTKIEKGDNAGDNYENWRQRGLEGHHRQCLQQTWHMMMMMIVDKLNGISLIATKDILKTVKRATFT